MVKSANLPNIPGLAQTVQEIFLCTFVIYEELDVGI